MMEKPLLYVLLGILIIALTASIVVLVQNENKCTDTYINKNANCVINFMCTNGKQAFHDECGCGCR